MESSEKEHVMKNLKKKKKPVNAEIVEQLEKIKKHYELIGD